MRYRRLIAILGLAMLMSSLTVGSALAAGNDKVTLCHATSSETNPYVEITVSENAALLHLQNHDGDFLSDPVTGCNVPPVEDPEPPVTGVDCVVSAGVTQTATTVTGTSGDDTIDCTNASPGKTITTGDGNDTITGTAFDDEIDSGSGNDTVTGGPGNDVIQAGDGNDTVTGGPGNDVIEGGNGNDTLTGSDGNDLVTDVGDGNDTITP